MEDHLSRTAEFDSLRAAQDDLTRFFELSLDLFCIASVEGYFLRVNPNFSRVLGYPEEMLLTQPYLDFVHPEDLAASRAAAAAVASGHPVVRFRNRFRDASRHYHWFEWSARAIPDEGTIFATARDITEQVRLEEELRSRERRERAIFDNTPAVVYVKNIDEKYEYVNQQYADLFLASLDPNEVIDKCDHEIFPPEIADAFVANDRRVIATGKKITIQETAPLADGLHTYVSAKFPLFNARGEVAAVAGISTDITDQIRLRENEEQLRLARAFQKKLYPAQAPIVEGLEAVGSAVPVALVCGDYYDFIENGPGKLIVAVGDVSGHGIGPALEMVAVRTTMRMLLSAGNDLVQTVIELNRLLCADLPEDSFVSLFLAEIDSQRKQIRYVGAGHQALLFPAAGGVIELKSTASLLGIDVNEHFEEQVYTPTAPNDLFLLFTDGLTEAMNVAGEQFHTRRVVDLIKQHQGEPTEVVIATLFSEVYEFASGRTITDDMTAIAVKVK